MNTRTKVCTDTIARQIRLLHLRCNPVALTQEALVSSTTKTAQAGPTSSTKGLNPRRRKHLRSHQGSINLHATGADSSK